MWKKIFTACAVSAAGVCWADSALTPTESRWLTLGSPAISWARQQGLPLDIVVQPQPTPGYAPLAMAFIDGRCKLVLSMRGNPEAELTLESLPPQLLKPAVEAMTAHELGHCWRYVNGAWHTVPAGFTTPRPAEPDDTSVAAQLREMEQTRREEAFADLVGLAWTAQRHPQHYAELHAWLMKFRHEPDRPGSHHDTVAWVRLAPHASAFPAADTLFEQAWPLWQQGLRAGK